MERRKAFLGWNCTLSPEEVEHAKENVVLAGYLGWWKSQFDGTATLRVAPWRLKEWYTMEVFIEGLGGWGFQTVNVKTVDGVERRKLEY